MYKASHIHIIYSRLAIAQLSSNFTHGENGNVTWFHDQHLVCALPASSFICAFVLSYTLFSRPPRPPRWPHLHRCRRWPRLSSGRGRGGSAPASPRCGHCCCLGKNDGTGDAQVTHTGTVRLVTAQCIKTQHHGSSGFEADRTMLSWTSQSLTDGMSRGTGAAVDIHLLSGDAQVGHHHHRYYREGLVYLKQVHLPSKKEDT